MTVRPLLAVLLASVSLFACGRESRAPEGEQPAAGAPNAPPSTAGVARYQVGDARVIALADGGFQLPADLFHGVEPAEVERLLRAAGDEPPPEGWVNAFLVDVGGRRVLIDTGAGAAMGPTAGKLFGALSAAGVDPASIQAVVISHMHPDHVGGLLDGEGRPRFPNATVHVHADERAFWSDEARAEAAPAEAKGYFQAAQAVLIAYGDRVRTFTDGEIVPGLSAEPVPGHTPGHSVYRLRSGDAEMVFLGDLIHSVAVQMPRPGVTVTFDNDQAAARAARLGFLGGLGDGALVAGPHFPYPGVARMAPTGEGYRYTPVAPTPTAPVQAAS